jgi:hypothetical protein
MAALFCDATSSLIVIAALRATEIPTRYREAAADGTAWQMTPVEYRENGHPGTFEVYVFQIAIGEMCAMFRECR